MGPIGVIRHAVGGGIMGQAAVQGRCRVQPAVPPVVALVTS